jgi:hypothetical protein
MVKNLPTVERSTKIRFGKNCTEDQAENTIVFNASNAQIDATHPGSVYMTPIRERLDFSDRNITVLTYNKITKEITDSDAVAEDIFTVSLEDVVINGNVTSNTVSFNNLSTSVTTLSNVGIANSEPIHTLDVGSKFYVDENDVNVLTVLGNTYVQEDLVVGGSMNVIGTVTVIDTVNTRVKDAIIEIGKGNVSSDMGIIMDRPGTNVTLGYREVVDEFVIAYTDSSATSSAVVPSSELIDVRVHGRLHTNSNLTVDTNTFHVDAISGHVGIHTVTPQTDLDVVGAVAISSNLTVDTNTLHIDSTTARVGINTLNPTTDFHVEGNTYVSGNVTVNTDTFHVDTVNDRVGINTLNPTTEFHVEGNTYVTGNVDVQTDLNVVGNAYVSSNVVVTGNVDVQTDLNVTGNVDVQSELNVTGNVFVDSNVMVVGNVHAATYYGDGGLLSNVTLQVISDYGNTTSNTIQFTNTSTSLVTLGSVGVANTAPIHDLDLGSNLFMEDTGSNVVHVTGNVYATRFIGDGATIGNVGIANTAPIHDLDLGSNLFMEDTGSNVVHVTGNVYATRFIGDGAFLENIASNFEQITENGNVTTGTIQFTNTSTSLVTLGSVGIANTAPIHDLNVGSNLYVEDVGSNVVHVTGNVYATRFIGDGAFLENIASNLEQITVNGNVTTGTIQFTNTTTALVTTGKVGISTPNPDANLHVTGNAYVSSNVEVTGNVIVDGGLIMNRSGLTKKTYGYSGGVIADGTTPEINVVFDSQLFSAKITAHLVEPVSNISVLNLDVIGGTGRNIGKGFVSIVGDQNSKHWDSVINTTETTVTLTPSIGPVGAGSYGISVEYTSPLGTGGVTSIDKDDDPEITFSY